MFVLAHYHKLIPKLIHEIKYQGAYAISSELAELIVSKYHHQFFIDYFVPVPLSKKREQDRGFNQAEKLAQGLVNSLRVYGTSRLPKNDQKAVDDILLTVVSALERVRETKPQFDLKYEERKNNVRGAFTLNQGLLTKNLNGFSFCLVDDVATTGSTLFECAKVLKKSGAEKVWAMTIARGG